jgi:hypothetical protein
MSHQRRPPLLREFIEIPEASTISDSDFVLKLADGISDIETTLKEYVIPPRLVDNFDQALSLISTALASGASRAAYLHGSFGSGKSHFMAVLHALLSGNRVARGRDDFAPLLAKHDSWLAGRRFLLAPYHMIGAKSLEQRVLGGYVEHILRIRPDATIPQVHRTDAQLNQARQLREQLGDEAFIALLPGCDEEDEWGERGWTTARLDAAFAAPPDDPARRELVHDLLSTWQQDFFRNALEDSEGFVSLDRGLTEIAGHAKDLGYDALVLFLDELILWLANSIGDEQFIAREIQKITNFVEGSDARRPIPVITFIARQRDLRELVGEQATGASELGFQDTLNLASGRFDLIKLEDRNLPEITRQRLLRRIGGDGGPADEAIASAFEGITRVRTEVWDSLLGNDAGTGSDLESFRKTYPFSPTFLTTLVHMSSALQRQRTALKLMRQLLVDRRDDLRLGQVVPLGDLYDVLTHGGDQPFTEQLKVEFDAAQRLYRRKFRPYLLDRYQLSDEDLESARRGRELDAAQAARVRSFTGDDRLIKTLLLGALAPSVPALHHLTARKLSALNHGSISSPIPGGEIGQISRKLEEWAGRFTELHVETGDNAKVSIELVGVEVDSVLSTVMHFDTEPNRKTLIQRVLWEEMGITSTGQDCDQLHLVWRGSRRHVEVIFGNVRDEEKLRDEVFHPYEPSSWRLIIDYPWDEGTHTPSDDRARVEKLKGQFQARTVCWIPASLTTSRRNDLGRLVVLDSVLNGQRFATAAKHLSEDNRQRAHAALTNQRDTLLEAFRKILRQAYGVATKRAEDVLTTYDEHLLSLTPGLTMTLPVGARFADAAENVADQMLRRQYPAHPDFDPDRKYEALRTPDLRVVLEYVRRAVESPEGRTEVDRKDRQTMRRIANPLQLGEMHEAAFVLGRHWVEHFHRRAAQEGIDGDVRGVDLRRWLDEPEPHGLDPVVAQLVLACFAEQTDRTWIRHGGVVTPQPELPAIDSELSLRTPERPDERDWQEARRRTMDLFGFLPPVLSRGRLVAMFVQDLSRQAQQYRKEAHRLVEVLEEHAAQLGLDLDAESNRLRTARMAADLLDGLESRRNNVEIVRQLARFDLGGPAERTGRSIRSAGDVVRALNAAAWDTFSIVADLGEPWSAEAVAVLGVLRQAACDDELTTPLGPALDRARSKATDLVRRATKSRARPLPDHQTVRDQPVRPASGQETGPGPAEHGGVTTVSCEQVDSGLADLREAAHRSPGRHIEISWRIL